MAITVARPRPRTALRTSSLHLPIWAAVVLSRVLVLAAGSAGALFTRRVRLWSVFDPSRLSSHLGAAGNVLAAPAVRWDSIHYLQIAQHGYTNAANTAFYPLYPLLMRALGAVVGSQVLAGVLISCVAFLVALVLLHRLTHDELGEGPARTTVLLLAFAPLSFFFTAVYTESLFLALLVGSFYLGRRGHFVWAGLVAAAATLTHVEGILLVAPLAFMYWQREGRSLNPRLLWSWGAAALALPAVALVSFCIYLHGLGYAWLAPVTSANTSNYGRSLVGPPIMLWRALTAAVAGLAQTVHGYAPVQPTLDGPFAPGFQNLVSFVILAIAVTAWLAVWRRLPREYAILAGLFLIVITSSAVVGRPLESFDRYTLCVFPLWMGAAAWLEQHRLSQRTLWLSSGLLVFYVVEFARWVFVA